jgi:hypothetical protein
VRPLLAASAVVVSGVLLGCGAQTVGTDSSPPVLHLTDSGTSTGVLAPAGADSGNGAPPYILATTLPPGTPAPAPVWRLPRAAAATAATVAAALDVGATTTAVAGGWVARRGTQLLAVRADGTWSWGLDCSPELPIDQERLDVECATASGGVAVTPGRVPPAGPTPPAPPPGPTVTQARALAGPILQRLGWGAAVVDVFVGAPVTTVTARRAVDDIATSDWLTTLSFNDRDQVVDASGWVGAPQRGRSYPLISADRAFALLSEQRRMVPELCRVRKDGKPGCEPWPPGVVTGATLGLSLRHDLGRPLLVPSWLFDIRGSAQPVAVVAVDPRWLKPPATVMPLPK